MSFTGLIKRKEKRTFMVCFISCSLLQNMQILWFDTSCGWGGNTKCTRLKMSSNMTWLNQYVSTVIGWMFVCVYNFSHISKRTKTVATILVWVYFLNWSVSSFSITTELGLTSSNWEISFQHNIQDKGVPEAWDWMCLTMNLHPFMYVDSWCRTWSCRIILSGYAFVWNVNFFLSLKKITN